MNINNLYYFLKPIIPRRTQIAARRLASRKKGRRTAIYGPFTPKPGILLRDGSDGPKTKNSLLF